MTDVLLEHLLGEASRSGFVPLLFWLERLLGAHVGAAEALPRLTLRHDPSLAFHAGDVHGAEALPGAEPRVAVTTTFAGLTGVASPLPALHVEAHAIEEGCAPEETALLGLLQHRLLALLYRGLIALDLARAAADAPVREWVLLLAGLFPQSRPRVTPLPPAVLLHLAPLLVAHPPNTERLRVAVRALFADLLEGAEVAVHALQGGFVCTAPQARARLGVDVRLGRTSALGSRCRAPAAAIALVLSPLTQQACAALGPGGARTEALVALVRLLVPETIATEVLLQPSTARASALGGGTRLKRDAWLGGGARAQPVRFTIA